MEIGGNVVLFLLSACLHHTVLCFGNHSQCLEPCMDEAISKQDVGYQECMTKCLVKADKYWRLEDETGCNLSKVDAESAPACSAKDIQVVSRPHSIPYDLTDSTSDREFIAVVWSPCPYGIGDVTGYEVQLFETEHLGYSLCKRIMLKETLDSESINEKLSVVFADHELDYSTKYRISIEGLPKSAHRYQAYLDYTSLPCTYYNGAGSCQCGIKGFGMLPPVNLVITGYTAKVSIDMLKECFAVHRYIVTLLHFGEVTTTLKTFTLKPSKSVQYEVVQYNAVYPSATNSKIFVQYRAFSVDGISSLSKSVQVHIKEWEVGMLTILKKGRSVTVMWECAAEYYNISKYEVKLSFRGSGLTDSSRNKVQIVESPCFQANVFWVKETFFDLNPGTYSVQVRERRLASPYFKPAAWSSVVLNSTFIIELVQKMDLEPSQLILAMAIVFPFLILLMLVASILYCSRKGCCKKMHHQLPFSIDFLFEGETFKPCSKYVWLVWQADNRNNLVKELHAENIRHLAAFLTNHCGLYVILDQYELYSSANLSAWIREKHKDAEFILFVCPHFPFKTKTCGDYVTACPVGNFMATYRFYENTILDDIETPRVISLILPYSQKDSCSAMELLLKTTPIFQLMDDIEDLYFFIQGQPKAQRFGRHVVKNIHNRDYVNTPEGKALQLGVAKMLDLQSGKLSIDDSFSDIEHRNEEMETIMRLLPQGKKNYIEAVRPESPEENMFLNEAQKSFRPNPPPPVFPEENAEESMFLINAEELLSYRVSFIAESMAVSAVGDHPWPTTAESPQHLAQLSDLPNPPCCSEDYNKPLVYTPVLNV